jgi:uncharacterized phosphosugar-binding protein
LRYGTLASSSGAAGPGLDGATPASEAVSAARVFALALALAQNLSEGQLCALSEAGGVLASSLQAGGSVYVFGTGHSRAVAMELSGRAGGLEGMKELVLDDLVNAGVADKDELLDGTLERRPEAALALLNSVAISPSDAFIVVSQSGCNGAPVEMALHARRQGLPVVAITSLEHSRAVTSRHPSGLRLFEAATLCIDTCAPYPDTAIHLSSEVGVCSLSSFAGVLIAQALTAEIVDRYLRAGVVPPVLVSRNLPGR